MVLDGLGLDRDGALDYIKTNQPTYPQFEQWVVDQNGGSIDQSVIDASNAAISGYHHADDTVAAISDAAATNADRSIKDAVTLNALEDWNDLHASLAG